MAALSVIKKLHKPATIKLTPATSIALIDSEPNWLDKKLINPKAAII